MIKVQDWSMWSRARLTHLTARMLATHGYCPDLADSQSLDPAFRLSQLRDQTLHFCLPSFLFKGTVTLTRIGTQVVSGEKSALGQHWVNDWVGGVRLSASHPPWLRTHDGLVECRQT